MMLMPDCREVSQWSAEGGLAEPSLVKRLLIRMHVSMCEHCGRFARQMGLIDEALRAAWSRRGDPAKLKAFEERVLERLKRGR